MNISTDTTALIRGATRKAHSILIISHKHPDADTVGSNIALRHFFETEKKQVKSACVDQPGQLITLIPESGTFISIFDPNEFDLFIAVDCGALNQTGFLSLPKHVNAKGKEFINIDHHISNDSYGTINLVEPQAASTTEIIYNLFNNWEIKFTPFLATCLLAGIYSDTGSFMHPNTQESTMNIAADLLSKGADHEKIVKNLFKNYSVEKLRLLGRALSNTKITEDNVAVSGLTQKDFEECGATIQETEGMIDFINSTPEAKIAALLSPDKKGNVKGSLRTRQQGVDVAKIAKNMGGGGHEKASGFSIKGTLEKSTHIKIKQEGQ